MNNKKRWDVLTPEEKTTLLNHWFYYYGGVIMTLKDMEDFRKLSRSRQDDIFEHIMTIFLYNRTIKSNMLIKALRDNKIEDLFAASLKYGDFVEYLQENIYEETKQRIFDELLQTFIYPEPPVPMDIAIVIDDENKGKTL